MLFHFLLKLIECIDKLTDKPHGLRVIRALTQMLYALVLLLLAASVVWMA